MELYGTFGCVIILLSKDVKNLRILKRKGSRQKCRASFLVEEMAKDFAKSFYASKRWEKCRKSYIDNRISIDGGMCEECHKNLGYIVHHKIAITEANVSDPNVTLSHDNLEYVCKDCHDMFEGHGLVDKMKPLFVFDEDGQPISLREIDKSADSPR